ncbi:hypothetical protein H6P81_007246 [Aristolochia fimbriata]|uniref:DUF659 domain-containing protein n=1 Tax=Aristolochia fimbriata TaxID=158543 RepID=A0AAV7EZS7_ARIFI|nr:hypothetical protein H6P81_007246 [Aristolochia fimbriata]
MTKKKRAYSSREGAEELDDDESGEPLERDKGVESIGTQSKNKGILGQYFPPRTSSGSQPSIRSVMAGKKAIEKAELEFMKWMYDSCIPLNALNSQYFQPMFDAISAIGPGFRGPTYHNARGKLLDLTIANINDHIESFKIYWTQTGCTLMADGWTDTCNRTLINFLVYCPRGLVFFKSVDASKESKTAKMLFSVFKEVIISVEVDNLNQIVIDNAANYVAVVRLLMQEFPQLYWRPCSAHCVDLMLEDFTKYIVEVQKVVNDASGLTKFVYNHIFVLTLMRKFSKGRELLRLGVTRFAINFLTLQGLQINKFALQAMVTSEEWTKNKISKTNSGKSFYYLVLNSDFWLSCAKVINIIEPLVKVLRMVDSDERPSMGYIFEGMKRVRETIRAVTKGKKEE